MALVVQQDALGRVQVWADDDAQDRAARLRRRPHHGQQGAHARHLQRVEAEAIPGNPKTAEQLNSKGIHKRQSRQGVSTLDSDLWHSAADTASYLPARATVQTQIMENDT